ncbi:MAG: hypothetical protein LBQ50_02275 [Planctomycetaceae bacterium]|nr:hypothetical protein [Planctomycetaceae bacterium]
MTIERKVVFLFRTILYNDLSDFRMSDNVSYVRLALLFSHYNDFNGAENSTLPLHGTRIN